MKKLIALFLALTLMLGIASPALAEYKSYLSETLSIWNAYYCAYVEAFANSFPEDMVVDTPFPSGGIIYDENSFTYGPYTGVGVIHGGCYSPNNTITMGFGTGMGENENYWYASITYSPECNAPTLVATANALLLASIQAGVPLETDDLNELMDFMQEVLQYDDIAVQIGDYVLVHKALSGGQYLLAIDSLAYYDEFYYNDTENYIVLE